jgi:hypothetical protein
MTKKIFLFIFSLFLISCEKEESDFSVLTSDIWALGEFSRGKQTIRFNEDNTYILDSKDSLYYDDGFPFHNKHDFTVCWTLSGNWTQQGDSIVFLNSYINLSIDDINGLSYLRSFPHLWKYTIFPDNGFTTLEIVIINLEPIEGSPGLAHGEFENKGYLHRIGETNTFAGEILEQRVWSIKKLTANSLIVYEYGVTLTYNKQ